MRERNGSQQSDGLLIKSNEEWCVSRAGEAKGDQRQDSGPSLNSANKPIQHSTSISWSTTVNTGFVFFFPLWPLMFHRRSVAVQQMAENCVP